MALIGLDIGTTGCKAHVFSDSLELIASASREYQVHFPHAGWAEQDAEHVWSLARECLRESTACAGVSETVRAIGLSVQGEAVAPVDDNGYAMRPMILGMDTRTDEQNAWLREHYGARQLFERTGMPIHTINTLPKLLWLKEHEPDTWRSASKFLLYEDFLIGKMTGRPKISQCLASRTQLYDLVKNEWRADILTLLELEADRLAQVLPSGAGAGQMLPDVAEELGIKSSPIVACGGHDQACGALGAGLTQAGLAMVSTGTAEVVEVATDQPHLNDYLYEGNMSIYRHTCPGLFVVMTLNQSGGFILRWFRDTFCQAEVEQADHLGSDVYDLLLANAPAAPSPVMLLPHFSGAGTPTFDTRSKGALVGLTFATRKSDIAKAILDGLTMELRLNLDILQKGGIAISELRAIGGGAKSESWLQLKADVTNIPVAAPQVTEAAGMGAAILAGVAAGVFNNPQSAVDAHLQIKKVYTPNPETKALYDQRYESYLKLYPALKEINHNL